MPDKKPVIVLFEDDDQISGPFVKAIQKALGTTMKVELFPLAAEPKNLKGTFDDRLVLELKARKDFHDIVLLVTDRDLSTAARYWGGLSESSVSKAARELGLPLACYRKTSDRPEDQLRRVAGDGLIELPIETKARAEKIASLARGFIKLRKLLGDREPKAISKTSASYYAASPGAVLAEALGQPSVASRLDTFASGDANAISEIIRVSTRKDDSRFLAEDKRRMVVALGVWLADQIMVYPGVLLDTTAAASYLNIDPKSFEKDEVRAVFKKALFSSKLPFADTKSPYWWRHLLDDIVLDNECKNGLDLCKKKGIKNVTFCPCSLEPTLPAGYVCMATGKPISEQNSSGRIRWFPIGADLARINKKIHAKLAPWIGA